MHIYNTIFEYILYCQEIATLRHEKHLKILCIVYQSVLYYDTTNKLCAATIIGLSNFLCILSDMIDIDGFFFVNSLNEDNNRLNNVVLF